MLIVDGQIHLWEKDTPSPQHRQEPYSAEQAIAAMDEAGVDRALIHPVLWDPDSNELAIAAVRQYPGRFAIMGWFYLDDPKGPDLVAHWKERPGGPAFRWRSPRRCSCRRSAGSLNGTRGSNSSSTTWRCRQGAKASPPI